jgi:hypothetical protein
LHAFNVAVLTGATAALTLNGQTVTRCRRWSLDIQKDSYEDTCLGTYDRTYIEGLRGATGSADILYDPDDAVTTSLLNRIFQDEGAADGLGLVLNTRTSTKLEFSALITSQSTPVSVGEAIAVSISFQVTGPITGSY